ncbi:MAG: LacI family DNA-binding transcriptional regulator [Phreatobacter sp.]|nr:LacI family DNA-binding transcriptional regulator [Phreatobacter sp.]
MNDMTGDAARPGRVTLLQIAQDLGVSTATVSLALRASPLVAEATREKVQERARSLGYVYNRSAASLRTARTNMIAVGVNDVVNPYFGEILAAIEETLAGSGHTVLLGTYSDDPVKQDRVLATLKEYRPDGMILCPANGSTGEALTTIAAAGIPVVQITREIDGVGLDVVASDDGVAARLALDHLHDLGHRRIAVVGGNDTMSTGRNRRITYRAWLAEKRLPFDPALMVTGLGTRDTGFAGIQALLDLAVPPTAAICMNDLIAFGVMMGLRQRGREAGRDFSVVGADDVREAAMWAPGLTTVSTHPSEQGRRACERVLVRTVNPTLPAARIILPPTLVLRGSTGPVGS